MLKFGIQVRYLVLRTIMWSKMTHVLLVSGQEPSKVNDDDGVVLDTLLILLES